MISLRIGFVALAATVCAAASSMGGCVGDLIELKSSDEDLSGGGADLASDMATSSFDMASGAYTFVDIETDLDSAKLGCSAGGSCHGGSTTPVLKPMATSSADLDANYAAIKMECNLSMPAGSLLLQNALGQQGHSGGARMTMADPEYARWLAWITAGAPR